MCMHTRAYAGNLLYVSISSSQQPETGLPGLYVALRTHPFCCILESRGSHFCSGFHAESQASLSVYIYICLCVEGVWSLSTELSNFMNGTENPVSSTGQSSTPYYPGRKGQVWPQLNLFIFISCQFLTRHPLPQPQTAFCACPKSP